MTARLKRFYGQGHLHFITFSCYQRLPLLKSPVARNVLVLELGKVRGEMGFQLRGYVVMPEHIHLLMSEPQRGTPSAVMQKLKRRVACQLRQQTGPVNMRQGRLPGLDEEQHPRSFWQARFYDFNVYSHGKKMEKLHYIHANPVNRGLVKHPGDWAWSSWGAYHGAESVLLGIDMMD